METFFIKALQLIVSLSILVLVHECGHFLFARLFKVRVDKFYLFFDPWFSIFKFKPKNSETEYGIGWLPLGGYCKIAGMIDESLDKEALKEPPQPYEFRSKPAGPRLLIMLAGVIFNFILALVIYSAVLFHWGDSYLPLRNVTCGMDYSSTFKEIGFADGDILLRADTTTLERYNEACLRQVLDAKTVTVLRGGEEVSIDIPSDMMQRILRDKEGFAAIRFPMVVKEVMSETAKQAGLQEGDRIESVGGVPTPAATDVTEQLKLLAGSTAEVVVLRGWTKGSNSVVGGASSALEAIRGGNSGGGERLTLNVPIDADGRVGFMVNTNISELYQTVKVKYNIFSAIPAGISSGVKQLTGYVSDMKYVFTKEGARSLGGFGAIGNMFPAVWDWRLFWERTAFLSIILAFMNILPIPALDGGHVLFLLVEVITRRKPGDKFLERAQIAGMAVLIALLLYANGNDLIRFFGQ